MSKDPEGCSCLLVFAGLIVLWMLSHRIGELRERVEQVELKQVIGAGR